MKRRKDYLESWKEIRGGILNEELSNILQQTKDQMRVQPTPHCHNCFPELLDMIGHTKDCHNHFLYFLFFLYEQSDRWKEYVCLGTKWILKPDLRTTVLISGGQRKVWVPKKVIWPNFLPFQTISWGKFLLSNFFLTPPRLAVVDKVLSNCSTLLCDILWFSEDIEDSLDGQLTNQTVRLFCQNN